MTRDAGEPLVNAAAVARDYAEKVVAGEIPACRLHRLACRRHLEDLKSAEERGLFFDPAAAQHAVDFFHWLRHSKGEWAGQRFVLAPWQVFIIASLFGWRVIESGLRRFRIAYVETPRKNGKTTLAAAVGLYLFFADGELGAEVYSAATKKDQAKITHSEATSMVRHSPPLRRRIGIVRDNLHVHATASKFEPLGADADTLDGLNVHGAVVDELHAHRTREVWDRLETGIVARRQPLIFAITTAGANEHTICREQHLYAGRVLDGTADDDSYFAFIAAPDKEDDWRSEVAWRKANPNLGVSVKLDKLRAIFKKAEQLPAAQGAFKRFHLDIWTAGEEAWIEPEAWDACGAAVDDRALARRACIAGIDLSSTTDLTAVVLYFPREEGEDAAPVKCYFFLPSDNLPVRVQRDRVPLDVWAQQGFIELTAGNIVDYGAARTRIRKLAEVHQITEIAYDPWNATGLVTDLQEDGFEVVPFHQGMARMSPPTKELEKLVKARQIAHEGNPVLRWCALNAVAREDSEGRRKFDRKRSRDRIDGIIALTMAVGRAMLSPPPPPSVYEERDPVVL